MTDVKSRLHRAPVAFQQLAQQILHFEERTHLGVDIAPYLRIKGVDGR